MMVGGLARAPIYQFVAAQQILPVSPRNFRLRKVAFHFIRQPPGVAALAIGEVEVRLGSLQWIAVCPERIELRIRVDRPSRIRVVELAVVGQLLYSQPGLP